MEVRSPEEIKMAASVGVSLIPGLMSSVVVTIIKYENMTRSMIGRRAFKSLGSDLNMHKFIRCCND